jgi:hypothetical protein
LAAVAEKQIRAAARAEIADGNTLCGDAGFEKLRAVCSAKIEADILWRGLVAGRHHVEPLERVGFVASAQLVEPFRGVRELRLEGLRNLGANFVAAAADGGADGGNEVFRASAEFHAHPADGFLDDALEGAAPTGVNSGDSVAAGVSQKYRDAISGLDREEETRPIRQRGIAAARLRGSGFKRADDVGMKLAKRHERHFLCGQGSQQKFAIFKDILARVPFGEAEVEDTLIVERAEATEARAESVDE